MNSGNTIANARMTTPAKTETGLGTRHFVVYWGGNAATTNSPTPMKRRTRLSCELKSPFRLLASWLISKDTAMGRMMRASATPIRAGLDASRFGLNWGGMNAISNSISPIKEKIGLNADSHCQPPALNRGENVISKFKPNAR